MKDYSDDGLDLALESRGSGFDKGDICCETHSVDVSTGIYVSFCPHKGDLPRLSNALNTMSKLLKNATLKSGSLILA
jgi:hypothetical protein